jgi:hypothetical protein
VGDITEEAPSRADPGKLLGIEDVLEAYEPTPEIPPGQAGLFLERGGRGFHFDWFFPLRHSHRHNANSTARLRSNTNRPTLDLFPDEFLDIG